MTSSTPWSRCSRHSKTSWFAMQKETRHSPIIRVRVRFCDEFLKWCQMLRRRFGSMLAWLRLFCQSTSFRILYIRRHCSSLQRWSWREVTRSSLLRWEIASSYSVWNRSTVYSRIWWKTRRSLIRFLTCSSSTVIPSTQGHSSMRNVTYIKKVKACKSMFRRYRRALALWMPCLRS